MTYSKKMKAYRFENNLKQSDITKKLGISQQVYSRIENGFQKPKIDFVFDYKKITGVDLADALNPPITNTDLPTINLDEIAELLNPRETIQALKQQIKALQQKIAALEKKSKK